MAPPKKTHCINGHERIPENLFSSGICKLCKKEHNEQDKLKRMANHHVKTHCKHGHERTPDNVNSNNACIICKNKFMRDYLITQPGRERNNARRQTPEYRQYMSEYHRKCCNNLENSYIAGCLNMSVLDATPELIELKRTQLKLKRFVNTLKKELENVRIPRNE